MRSVRLNELFVSRKYTMAGSRERDSDRSSRYLGILTSPALRGMYCRWDRETRHVRNIQRGGRDLPAGTVVYRHWSAASPRRCRRSHHPAREVAVTRRRSARRRCAADSNSRNNSTRTPRAVSSAVLCAYWATWWPAPAAAAPGTGSNGDRSSRSLYRYRKQRATIMRRASYPR